MKTLDRYIGCLVGLAFGDAYGTRTEFKQPGEFEEYFDLVIEGGGPFKLEPGQWTDDTSMALCLAESIIKCDGGFNSEDQMKRYLDWYTNGHLSSNGRCFDIGGTTAGAIARFSRDGNPIAGATHEHSAGNGSLMRLAPIPMMYRGYYDRLFIFAENSSKTTHAHPDCLECCTIFSYMIADALAGKSKEEILDKSKHSLSEPHVKNIAYRSYLKKDPPQIKGTGYVVDTLEAALWAFATTDNFEDGMIKVANLGDDSDTTCAVYGQIAGAYYGIDAMPDEEVDKLSLLSTIITFATQLYILSDKIINEYT